MKQFTLVVEVNDKNKYGFKNYTEAADLIAYVTNMSKGPNKVKNIFSVDENGKVEYLTIGFIDGKLQLIRTSEPLHQERTAEEF